MVVTNQTIHAIMNDTHAGLRLGYPVEWYPCMFMQVCFVIREWIAKKINMCYIK